MIAFVALLLAGIPAIDQGDKPVSQDIGTLLASSAALQIKGDFAQAERMVRQFLTTETILPVDKVIALNALGVILGNVDRNEEAERYFRRALDLAEHNPEILPLTLLRIRFNLTTVYVANHRYQKAQALVNTISEAEAIHANERWRLASLRGGIAIRMADYELGNEVFEAYLKKLDSSKPSPELAITLNNLGIIGLFRKDFVAANRYLSEAATAWRAIHGILESNRIRQGNMLRTLSNLAIAQEKVGNKDGARATLTEALTMARTQFGDSDPLTGSICQVSAGILSRIGSKHEAKELKRMAQRIRQQQPPAFGAGAVVNITELSALR